MIRSSKVTLRFANDGKQEAVSGFIAAYRKVVEQAVELLWNEEKVPSLLPKELTDQLHTSLSARVVQSAGKQASGVVRGAREKQKRRLYIIQKLTEEGKTRRAKKLQAVYDKASVSKPRLKTLKAELDSRFVKINLGSNKTSFDGWVTLKSMEQGLRLVLPFKKTRHLNNLLRKGVMRPGIRLSNTGITFMFKMPDVPERSEGTILGIDIGQKNVLSVSNGWCSVPNQHGHDLNTIQAIISRRKMGSLGFKRATDHRTNYINWTVNQMNLTGVKQVNIEDIKHLRRGKRSSRMMSHWTYAAIFDKLESFCAEQGVLVSRKSPTYTSQRCSLCGWTRKSNRKGKSFKCGKCGHALDADWNASQNLALPLPAISRQHRLKQPNRTGFYWLVEGTSGQVPIVPVVSKLDCSTHELLPEL